MFTHRKHLVQIVEDDKVACAVLERMLKHERWNVLVANDLENARMQLDVFPIDLIILDSMLPDGSGLDYAASIRGQILLKDIPIVLYTSDEQASVRETAAGLGIDIIIPKPADTETLRGAVSMGLSKAPERWKRPEELSQRLSMEYEEVINLQSDLKIEMESLGKELAAALAANMYPETLSAAVLRVKSAVLVLGAPWVASLIDTLWGGEATPTEDLRTLSKLMAIGAVSLANELEREAVLSGVGPSSARR